MIFAHGEAKGENEDMRTIGFALAALGCFGACVDQTWEDDPAYRTGLYPRLTGTSATGAEILECEQVLSREDQIRSEEVLWKYSAALYGADTAFRQKQAFIVLFRRCPDSVVAISSPDSAKGGVGLISVLFLDPKTMQVLKSTVGNYAAIVDHFAEQGH